MSHSWTAVSEKTRVTVYEDGAVKVNGRSVTLLPKERECLLLIAEGYSKVITTRELLAALYRLDDLPNHKIIVVMVCRLRKKISGAHPDHPRAGDVIKTVWGRGYAFGVPDQEPVPLSFPDIPKPVRIKLYERCIRDINDLPLPTQRWVPARKALAILLVDKKILTIDQLLARYPDLTLDEYGRWRAMFRSDDVKGLQTTRTQEYMARDMSA